MADGQGPGAVRAYEGLEGLEGAGLMCIRPRRNQGYGTCGIVRNLACMLQAPSHQGACRLAAGTVHSPDIPLTASALGSLGPGRPASTGQTEARINTLCCPGH
jgi:hypothetical protein